MGSEAVELSAPPGISRPLTAITALYTLAFAITLVFERNWSGKVYNLLTEISLAGILLLLTRRIYLSLAASCFVCSWIWIVSEVKFHALGQHLFPQDFILAFKTADVLWTFEAPGLVASLLAAGGLAIIFWYERAWRNRPSMFFWLGVSLAWLATIGVNLRNVDFTFLHPRVNSLAIFVQGSYRLNFTDPHIGKPSFCCLTVDEAAGRFTKVPTELPNIVVILAESLFDPARIRGFRPSVPVPRDFSPLHVWTRGGQSWTQEISVLHGVPPPKYGSVWPLMNLLVSEKRLPGRMPNMLKSVGYQATTVYPVNGELYGARLFHMTLGIQRFIDCQAIPECAAQARWQDRSDAIFFRRAAQIMSAANTPQFVFISTVHLHSPHDRGRPTNPARCDTPLSQSQCSILMDFEDRLKDSFNDYDAFLRSLRALSRRSIVVMFGDHIPEDVSNSFADTAFIDGDRYRTVFHMWDSRQGDITKQSLAPLGISKPVDIAFLDAIELSAAGFESAYLRDKLSFLRECDGSYCGTAEEH